MAKQFTILIIASILAVFFLHEIGFVVHGYLKVHDELVKGMGVIFSGDQWGRLILLALALFIIPAIVGLILAGVHWLFKRIPMPFTMEVIWMLWLVLITALALQTS